MICALNRIRRAPRMTDVSSRTEEVTDEECVALIGPTLHLGHQAKLTVGKEAAWDSNGDAGDDSRLSKPLVPHPHNTGAGLAGSGPSIWNSEGIE
jgi:hypothetical protein